MKIITTIAKKEMKTFLSGPGFYVILFLFAALVSYIALVAIQSLAQTSDIQARMGRGDGANLHMGLVAPVIQLVHLLLLMFIPALTAYAFAEEKKTRTIDLLLTSPITSTQIVLGKFLAAVGLTSVLIGISMVYPVSVHWISPLDVKLFVASYLGLFLVSLVYISIGLFASSVSQSIIVSYVIGLVISLFCIFTVWGTQSVENQTILDILNHISISKHFQKFIEGTIQVVSVVFPLSLAAFFVFLTQRVLESTRWR